RSWRAALRLGGAALGVAAEGLPHRLGVGVGAVGEAGQAVEDGVGCVLAPGAVEERVTVGGEHGRLDEPGQLRPGVDLVVAQNLGARALLLPTLVGAGLARRALPHP